MSRKRTLSLLILFLTLAALAAPFAEAVPYLNNSVPSEGAPGVVVLVREHHHLAAALQTAEALRSGAAPGAGKVEIIVCGKASSNLQRGSDLEDALRVANSQGVTVTACGMSLESASIDPGTLLDFVQVVPNGLLRVLELQESGYLSVEL